MATYEEYKGFRLWYYALSSILREQNRGQLAIMSMHPTECAVVINTDNTLPYLIFDISLPGEFQLLYPFVHITNNRILTPCFLTTKYSAIMPNELVKTLIIGTDTFNLMSPVSSLNGLFNGETVEKKIRISCPKVTSLQGIGNVTTRAAQLDFEGLTDLTGLDQITTVNSVVVIPFLPNKPLILPTVDTVYDNIIDPAMFPGLSPATQQVMSSERPYLNVMLSSTPRTEMISCDTIFDQFLPKLFDYNIKHNTRWRLSARGMFGQFDVSLTVFNDYKQARSALDKDMALAEHYDNFKLWYTTYYKDGLKMVY